MEHPDTLYPYELLSLLEALHEQGFSGRVTLHADDGRTLLYLVQGQVRYATTTGVRGSFPAYLITEDVFPRDRLHRWLETCTDDELSMEAMLLQRRRVDPDGLVCLKADLSAMVFAQAYTFTAMVEIEPFQGTPPNFGDLVLDPYTALFCSVADGPVHGPMLDHFQGYWQRPIRRGASFFVLLPEFRRWFGRTPLPALVDDAPLLADLASDTTQVETVVAQLFAMTLSGMVFFQGDRPKGALARGTRAAAPAAAAAPSEGVPPAPPPEYELEPTTDGPIRRDTEPGGLPAMQEMDTLPAPDIAPTQIARTPAPVLPKREVTMRPPPPPPQQPVFAESEALNFADLRGSLVGEGLLEAARVARGQNEYELLGVEPRAMLSEIRSAFQRARKRYDDDNYDGYYLPPKADAALSYLQQRIETAYETLIDLRRRREHDDAQGIDGLDRQAMEQLFYAEGVFKAAQIRMAKGLNAAAMELLEEALEHAPNEPEYISYLAWAAYSASLAGQPLPASSPSPEYLLDRALAMSPKLESAWLFKARMADQAEDGQAAVAAYYSVLTANPDNEEARTTIDAYKNAGVTAGVQARPKLADRLAQILRRK